MICCLNIGPEVKHEVLNCFVLKPNLSSRILAALISDLERRTTLPLDRVSRPLWITFEEVSNSLEKRTPLEVASSLHSLADSIMLLSAFPSGIQDRYNKIR